jgi:predicted alpha/beta hydrolase
MDVCIFWNTISQLRSRLASGPNHTQASDGMTDVSTVLMLAVCHDDQRSPKESSEPFFDFGSSYGGLLCGTQFSREMGH